MSVSICEIKSIFSKHLNVRSYASKPRENTQNLRVVCTLRACELNVEVHSNDHSALVSHEAIEKHHDSTSLCLEIPLESVLLLSYKARGCEEDSVSVFERKVFEYFRVCFFLAM